MIQRLCLANLIIQNDKSVMRNKIRGPDVESHMTLAYCGTYRPQDSLYLGQGVPFPYRFD